MEANLGPNRVRWSPTTEADIKEVVDSAALAESHYIDVKREVGDTPSKRKETAKDLSSFAIDGGALLIGVHEDKATQTFSLAPQPLSGLVEKIENVAATAIDPPLSVVVVEIPSEEAPETGYVLVNVPPSAYAPHMVDDRYHGRGERTTRKLTDAEVLALHGRRESTEVRVGRLLDRDIAREPVAESSRRLGHMYLVAEPVGAPKNVAQALVRGQRAALDAILRSEPEGVSSQALQFEPVPRNYLTYYAQRSKGAALYSHVLSGPGRTTADYPAGYDVDDGLVLDIEVQDGGAIHVLMGRLTARFGPRFSGREYETVICDKLAVAYVRRIIHWAVEVGNCAGWRGNWALGVHGDRLRGLASHVHREAFGFDDGNTFDEDHYREVTTASQLEMEQRPAAVADRLIGRLTHALGTNRVLRNDLTDSSGE